MTDMSTWTPSITRSVGKRPRSLWSKIKKKLNLSIKWEFFALGSLNFGKLLLDMNAWTPTIYIFVFLSLSKCICFANECSSFQVLWVCLNCLLSWNAEVSVFNRYLYLVCVYYDHLESLHYDIVSLVFGSCTCWIYNYHLILKYQIMQEFNYRFRK